MAGAQVLKMSEYAKQALDAFEKRSRRVAELIVLRMQPCLHAIEIAAHHGSQAMMDMNKRHGDLIGFAALMKAPASAPEAGDGGLAQTCDPGQSSTIQPKVSGGAKDTVRDEACGCDLGVLLGHS